MFNSCFLIQLDDDVDPFQAYLFPIEYASNSRSSSVVLQASNSNGNLIAVTPQEAKGRAEELLEEIRVLERLKKRLEEELESMLKISSQETVEKL